MDASTQKGEKLYQKPGSCTIIGGGRRKRLRFTLPGSTLLLPPPGSSNHKIRRFSISIQQLSPRDHHPSITHSAGTVHIKCVVVGKVATVVEVVVDVVLEVVVVGEVVALFVLVVVVPVVWVFVVVVVSCVGVVSRVRDAFWVMSLYLCWLCL